MENVHKVVSIRIGEYFSIFTLFPPSLAQLGFLYIIYGERCFVQVFHRQKFRTFITNHHFVPSCSIMVCLDPCCHQNANPTKTAGDQYPNWFSCPPFLQSLNSCLQSFWEVDFYSWCVQFCFPYNIIGAQLWLFCLKIYVPVHIYLTARAGQKYQDPGRKRC